MKKIIAAAMAAVMVISLTAATSFAASDGDVEIFDEEVSFNDVDESSAYYDAIMNVAQAGIMTGHDTGDFDPAGNITRAEFATIICRLAGVDTEAQQMTTSIFEDVPATHWAVGRVAMAVQLGIVNGYDDTSFGPSDDVTYEQAIKMLVCTEYDYSNVESLGGYPDGYISIAKSNGLLDGISYNQTAAASRGNIAKMINNTLDVAEGAEVYVSNDEYSIIIN